MLRGTVDDKYNQIRKIGKTKMLRAIDAYERKNQ